MNPLIDLHISWSLEQPCLPWDPIDLDVSSKRLFKSCHLLSVDWMPGTIWYSLLISQKGEQAQRGKQHAQDYWPLSGRTGNQTLIHLMLKPFLLTIIAVFLTFYSTGSQTFSTSTHRRNPLCMFMYYIYNNIYIFIKWTFHKTVYTCTFEALWNFLLYSIFPFYSVYEKPTLAGSD